MNTLHLNACLSPVHHTLVAIQVKTQTYQVLYVQDNKIHAMHPDTFDQVELDASLLKGGTKDLAYIQDGMSLQVDSIQGDTTTPLLVHLPSTHAYTILSDEPGIGQASKGVSYKTAYIGDRVRIMVPEFVKV